MKLALIALPIYAVIRLVGNRWELDFDDVRGLVFWACVVFLVIGLAAWALGFGDEWERAGAAIENWFKETF